jgi:3-oxoacyl-[acyl-carrier protein] reductase
MTLDGKTAFISGSGHNIGRAIALEFAERGANVVINGLTDRDSAEGVADEARSLGVGAIVTMGSVGDSAVVKEMASAALSEFGSVDIVVNNAAIRPHKPFLEMDENFWHNVISVDMHSAFYTGQAFVPGMVKRGWGRVVNITGMNAMHGYNGRCPVSAAKHGLWGITKSMAKEFGSRGITANAISPGPIEGDYRDASMDAHIREQEKLIPVGHLGKPMHIAGLCGFLVSEEGGFVSGQMINCNGATQT